MQGFIMEKFEAVGKLIKEVGFPIVMCLIMFWFIQTQTVKQNEILTNLIVSINNNTKAIEAIEKRVGK